MMTPLTWSMCYPTGSHRSHHVLQCEIQWWGGRGTRHETWGEVTSPSSQWTAHDEDKKRNMSQAIP